MNEVAARRAILERALAKMKVHDLDLEWAARETFGMSSAELVRAVSDSSIVALRRSKNGETGKDIAISKADFLSACDRIRYGDAPRSGSVDEKILRTERECTAWHEAGHLLLRVLLFGEIPERATIVPRGDYGGFVRTSEEDTKRRAYGFRRSTGIKEIAVCLGGGVAEDLKFNEHSSGVSSDRQKAWTTAYDMVAKWGMGPIEAEAEGWLSSKGNGAEGDHAHSGPAGGDSMRKAVAEIIQEASDLAGKALEEHRSDLERAATLLLEHEDLEQETLRQEFGGMTYACETG